MSQSHITQNSVKGKVHFVRKTSQNSSIESNVSSSLKKDKFALKRKNTKNVLLDERQNYQDHCESRKLKICQGQRISYEALKNNSKQKREQFMEKYAHDPFMRRKFDKSAQKFNRSKSKQMIDKQAKDMNNSIFIPSKVNDLTLSPYTTFREQVRKQSQMTVKLINNCKSLVEELRKNRLLQDQQKGGSN